MEFTNQIIIFIIGAGAIVLLYYLINFKKEYIAKGHDDLTSLKNHMQSIQQSLQNFLLILKIFLDRLILLFHL